MYTHRDRIFIITTTSSDRRIHCAVPIAGMQVVTKISLQTDLHFCSVLKKNSPYLRTYIICISFLFTYRFKSVDRTEYLLYREMSGNGEAK